jgi:hypothetical protein
MIKVSLSHIGNAKQDFYDRICKDGPYSYVGLITRIKRKILIEPSIARVRFYYDLLRDVKGDCSTSIIVAEPNELAKRIEHYNLVYCSLLANEIFRKEILDEVFFYESYDKWQAYRWAKIIKADVCPYCNRQYTFTLETTDGRTRPQYDHFFDKATYPYLSLSFYNLVPSCSICNSSLKGSEKFTLETNVHPYLEGFNNDIKFSIRPRNINFINGKPEAYKIIFRYNLKDMDKARRAASNIRTFKLHSLYNMHKDSIDELIIKSRIYNKEYIKSLFTQYKDLFTSIDDVKRMVIANYHRDDELGKRTLSKFISDIAEELGII